MVTPATEMIGILGGSFDPVHQGHLHIARESARRLRLAQVQFVPCGLPVHRDPPRATARQRCEMLELALRDETGMRLNRLEVDREGPSYTVDSLRELSATAGDSLVLLLGADAFNGFAAWKRPDEILRFANVAICRRPGVVVDAALYPDRRVDSARGLSRREAGAILVIDVEAPECSSSSVREALADNRIPRPWLHPAVADYIENHRLYRSQVD